MLGDFVGVHINPWFFFLLFVSLFFPHIHSHLLAAHCFLACLFFFFRHCREARGSPSRAHRCQAAAASPSPGPQPHSSPTGAAPAVGTPDDPWAGGSSARRHLPPAHPGPVRAPHPQPPATHPPQHAPQLQPAYALWTPSAFLQASMK